MGHLKPHFPFICPPLHLFLLFFFSRSLEIAIDGQASIFILFTFNSRLMAFHGSLARRLAIRTLMFALVTSILPLLQLVIDIDPAKPMFMSSNGVMDVILKWVILTRIRSLAVS